MEGCIDINLKIYRDFIYNIGKMQSTMIHPYLDDRSRYDSAKGNVAARGVALAAETLTCNRCGKGSHYDPNCLKKKTWGQQHRHIH